MEKSIAWSSAASLRLLEIIEMVSKTQPDKAYELGKLIHAKVDALAIQPNRHRAGRITGTREMAVRPNYVVVYRVTDAEVQVLSIRSVTTPTPN